MSDFNYHLPAFGTLMTHFPQTPLALQDGPGTRDTTDDAYDDDVTELLIQARIRSGDYFVTLATELDKMAQGLSRVDAAEAPWLERIVSELLYLDKNFDLTKK